MSTAMSMPMNKENESFKGFFAAKELFQKQTTVNSAIKIHNFTPYPKPPLTGI